VHVTVVVSGATASRSSFNDSDIDNRLSCATSSNAGGTLTYFVVVQLTDVVQY